MKIGVSITPWLSVRWPRRAWPSDFSNSNCSMRAIVSAGPHHQHLPAGQIFAALDAAQRVARDVRRVRELHMRQRWHRGSEAPPAALETRVARHIDTGADALRAHFGEDQRIAAHAVVLLDAEVLDAVLPA